VTDRSVKMDVKPLGTAMNIGIGGGHPKLVSITTIGRHVDAVSQLSLINKHTLYNPAIE
jgi:hypothetical protein